MANPIMAFLAFFVPMSKPRYISLCTLIGMIFGGFLLCTALHSPDMLLGQEVGGALTVSLLLNFNYAHLTWYTVYSDISKLKTIFFFVEILIIFKTI